MYFITSPVMLDMVKMLTPESIANVSNSLRFNKQEFVQYCNAENARKQIRLLKRTYWSLQNHQTSLFHSQSLQRNFHRSTLMFRI